MSGLPCIAVEIAIPAGGTLYLSTHQYISNAADTPASTPFEPRIADDVSFEREVGCVFWGSRPRGAQNIGRIRVVNADGFYDSYVGISFRDMSVVLKRGNNGDAYSSFATVATLTVDRLEFVDERYIDFIVKDRGSQLERPLQGNPYPSTLTNFTLRGKPRPITIGQCFQVPVTQPDVFGLGNFDLHDDEQWIGVTQFLDQGASIIEGTGYRRSSKTGIYGVERLTAIGGAQAANVWGRFKILSTDLTDDFPNLTNWLVLNGGVGGRDATIVSNELRMLNTLGGADLVLQWQGSPTTVGASGADLMLVEFDCTQWTSGSVQFRTFSSANFVERTIDGVGRYTFIVRSAAAWLPRFYAINGSNADLRIDNLRIRKIQLVDQLADIVSYLCTVKGPLTTGQLDTTAINALESATAYRYGFHASDPIQIADVMDQFAQSLGGWWYVNRTGLLTFGRLLAPTGTAVLTFDVNNIDERGMRIELDAARGLSNVIQAKRNWAPFSESELVGSLNYVQLNVSDKDADVALSNSNYTYSATNVGSVRSTPSLFGERVYFEITVSAIGGGTQHYIGAGNTAATITSYPGGTADSISYRANGQSFTNATGSAYGTAWAATDVISVLVDGRPAAMGSKRDHVRVYFARNGTWQNGSNPATETGYLPLTTGQLALAQLMVGGNAAETNTGTVNFGQSPFVYTPPADAIALAWQRQLLMSEFRYQYESTVALAAAYSHADNAPTTTDRSDNEREYTGGIPTLLARDADAKAECDRWATLYSVERYFATFTALLDSGTNADQLEPGDVIEVTWPRYGLTAKKMRVAGVSGSLFGREVQIRAWF